MSSRGVAGRLSRGEISRRAVVGYIVSPAVALNKDGREELTGSEVLRRDSTAVEAFECMLVCSASELPGLRSYPLVTLFLPSCLSKRTESWAATMDVESG